MIKNYLSALLAVGAIVIVAENTSVAGRNEDLIQAIRKGNPQKVEQAINKGAAVDRTINYGRTALMFATQLGHLEIVNVLINKSADVNYADREGRTALIHAALYRNTNIENALVARGARQATPVVHAENVLPDTHFKGINHGCLPEPDETTCAICLTRLIDILNSDINGGVVQVGCPARHMFCKDCIKKAYKRNQTCSLCRQQIGSIR